MSNSSRGRRWTGWMTRRPSLLRPFPILRCEELEDRRTPTTFTWTGLGTLIVGGNNNWSNPANWSTSTGPGAPTGLASEQDDLVFPQLSGQTTVLVANNDISGGVFNSIAISTTAATAAYKLVGNPLTLGEPGVTGSGFVTVNAGSGGGLVTTGANGAPDLSGTNTLAMAITLGASAGSDQFFTVQAGAALNMTGQLSDSLGSSLTQEGPGILGLGGNNQGFTGPIKLDNITGAGTVLVENATALGGTTSPGTTVGTGSTLALSPNIGTVRTPLRLNGQGVSNAGALLNEGGANTWAGAIVLDSNSFIGSAAGTGVAPSVLNITGVISDSGAGHNLNKEGSGEVQLNPVDSVGNPSGNTYRGLTTVDNGVLTVGTGTALGANTTPPAAPDPRNGVIVNSTLTGSGQLRLLPLNGTGFTVINKYLTLNGDGVGSAPSPSPLALADRGAFTNALGTNTWAGPVNLGSPIPQVATTIQIGAYAGTNLVLSGPVSSPNADFTTLPFHPYTFIKVDSGTVILNNANTYVGGTDITKGVLDVRDSMALGVPVVGSPIPTGWVTVENGATLQLDVEAGLPPTAPGNQSPFAAGQDPGAPPGPRDLNNDSVTHDANKLQIGNRLTILGRGVNGAGALRSSTGINVWTGSITLGGPNNLQDAIGVDQDPRNGHPTPTSGYLASDYGLTVSSQISGGDFNDFIKTGGGDLVLATDNTYTGLTRVEQGWVTVESNNALGGLDTTAIQATVQGGVANSFQPATFVMPGAAVHIKAPAGTSLSIPENIYIAGTGPSLPYAFLSQKGALVNLDGNNTWTGTIGLIGQAGVGVVETVPGSASGSSLTVTGAVVDGKVAYRFASTGAVPEVFPIDTWGATSGTLHVYYDPSGRIPGSFFIPSPPIVPTRLTVYDPPPVPPVGGANKIYDSGSVIYANTVDVPFNSTSTILDLVMNEPPPAPAPGVRTNTDWVVPEASIPYTGGLVKLGYGQLALQGPGTYTQATNVVEGTLLAQNNTALGLSSSGTATSPQVYGQTPTTVQSGAVLQLGQTVPSLNGGVQNGVQISNEQLILNSPAQQIAVAGDQTPAPNTFTLTFNGQTTAPIPTGASAAQVQAALDLLSSIQRSEVQSVQVIGTGGAFTLTFNGQTTGPIAFGSTAGQVQAALDALSTIGGVGGSVTVTAITVPGGTQYTVTFGGSQIHTNLPPIVAAPLDLVTATVRDGSPTAPEIQTLRSYLTDGSFTLTFNGRTTSPLPHNATASQVQSALNALQSVATGGGNVSVNSAVIPGGIQYTITFGGSLATTNVSQITATLVTVLTSTVTAGSPTQSAVQAVQVYLTGGGTFTLTFNGQTTAPLAAGATAAQVQAALTGLSTIGAGNVTVASSSLVPTGTQYTVTFTGSKARQSEPLITAAASGFDAFPTVATVRDGLNGNVTVVEVPVGGSTRYDVTFGGDLANTNLPVMGAGMPTASVATVQPGGPGQSAVQTASVFLVFGTFTLTFQGQTTSPLATNATSLQVQTALEALSNIGAGNVTVSSVPVPGGTQYTITFGGSLANTALPQMTVTANGVKLPGVSILQAGGGAVSEVQSILEAASTATFTLSYKGQTTTPIPITATASQVQAAINSALLSLTADNAATQPTVTRTGNVFTVLFVPTATDIGALTATPASAAPFLPELSVSGVTTLDGKPSEGSLISQYAAVQNLQVTGTSGTYQLSFTNPQGTTSTTVALPFNATAVQIQAALNALPSIGGVGGTATVFPIASGFSVTFGGTLVNQSLQLLTVAGTAVATITAGPSADDYAWRGPVTMNSGTRVATAGNSRLSLFGTTDDANNEVLISTVQAGSATQSAVQTIQVFGNGGAFTLTFNGATTIPLPFNATAVQVQDALNTLPTLGGVGGVVTVTTTSLPGGTQFTITFGSGLANTSVPQLIGTSLSVSTSTVQAGGLVQSAIQNVSVFLTSGKFLLTFNGQTTAPLPFNETALNVQAALTNLATIGGVGGNVVVTAATSTGGTVYTITFGGSLANKVVPLITAGYNGADLVKRGQGELVLFGSNTYRGTTYIDQGIVTAANSQAFGTTTNGTVVAAGAQLQLEGGITIAGEPLTVQGAGVATPSTLTDQWFNVGPAPTNNGQSPKSLPTSGRVVSVAADPTDPNIIYIATAGGGAWKTIDGGHHWTPLFDSSTDPAAAMWGAAVAVAPTDPHTIYFATGDSFGLFNGSPITGQADNFAGTGVYRSTDSGATWTLLTNPDGSNPLFGQAITQLVVDPLNATRIFVASSNIVSTVGGTSAGVLHGIPTATPGVYRFTPAQGWYDMTGKKAISPARQNGIFFPGQGIGTPGQSPYDAPKIDSSGNNSGGLGPPGTIGPNDDYRITFPGSDGTVPQFAWSSLSIVNDTVPGGPPSETLYAALYAPGDVLPFNYASPIPANVVSVGQGQQFFETAPAGFFPQQAILNAVYRTSTLGSDNPTWNIGDGGIDSRSAGTYPTGPVADPQDGRTLPGRNGAIKVTAVTDPASIRDNILFGFPVRNVVYASNLVPDYQTFPYAANTTGQLLDIQKSTTSGNGWAATGSLPPNPFGVDTPTSSALGQYDNAILAQDYNPNAYIDNNVNTVYLAGQNNIWETQDGGASWTAINPDASGNGPGVFFHALALDMSNRLLTGSDGGVWRAAAAPPATNLSFSDLNGDLSITQLNGVDVNPTDPNQAILGSQNNGIQQIGNPAATSPAGQGTNSSAGVNGGIVRYNTQNPLIQYAAVNGALYQTQNGGVSWTKLLNVSALDQFPLAVDRVNPSRVVIGGGSLQESTAGGVPGSFINLLAPTAVTTFGLATYQGPFQPDPGFSQVTDQLSNTYTPGTIYISDGKSVNVTKNEGVTWVSRGPTVTDTTYTVTFKGSLRIKDVNQLVGVGALGVHVRVATPQQGSPTLGLNEIQTVEITGNGGTFTLSFTDPNGVTRTTTTLLATATAAQVQAALDAILNLFVESEIQTVKVLGTTGAFSLTFNGNPTPPLPALAPNGQVQAALWALPGLNGNVTVTSTFVTDAANNVVGIQYTLDFSVGALANTDVNQVTAQTVNIQTSRPVPGPPTQDQIDLYLPPGSQFTLTYVTPGGTSDTTAVITVPLNGQAVNFQTIQNALNGLNSIGGQSVGGQPGSVTVSPSTIPGFPLPFQRYTVTFGGGLAGAVQNPITATVVSGGGPVTSSTTIAQGGQGSATVSRQILANIATVTSIAVDPSNRDTVYITESYPHGQNGPQVFRSTDAGQSWVDLTGDLTQGDSALPAGSAWSSTVDPRTDTLYIGTENGVWRLPHASTTVSGSVIPIAWSRFGAGMPAVKVTDLVLNQTLNTLTAATYGRGAYQLFLTDYAANTGAAVRAISGSSVWTGPVTLVGDTTIAADGTQNVQNGIAAASVNFLGTINDQTTGPTPPKLTVGTATGLGTVILSGTNTYKGQTDVRFGILEVNNPNALGAASATGNTVVEAGAQLALESDLQAEPITIFGDGIPFNGHNTGALRNVSNNNTYTGTLTLGSNATIGVDSGTTLTIGVKPGLQGTGTVTDAGNNFSLIKESTGTLILADADTYGGLTTVNEGVIQVQNGNALGAGGTLVRDGAQVQISRNSITLAPTVVLTEALTLAGTGIFGTGALENVRGDTNPTGSNDNTWAGPITFTDRASAAGQFPSTTPGSQIAIGVADSGVPGIVDTLILNTTIVPDNPANTQTSLGLIKVGPGRLTLAQANNYTGVTNINAGSVRVQNANSLGSAPFSAAVQTITVVGTTNPLPYSLTFEGQSTGFLSSNATAATVAAALNALPTINGNVVVTGSTALNSQQFTVTFTGALAIGPVPLITATNVASGLTVTVLSAQAGGAGVVVAPGAALEVDGDPTHNNSSLTLNKVLTVNGDGPAGTATVTSAPITGGTVYTVSLGGALGGLVLPPLTATGANGATVSVTTPQIEAVNVSGNDGTFTLTFSGQTTAQIPFNATAAQVQAALNALPAIVAAGSVSVTLGGTPTAPGGSTYLVTFDTQPGAPEPQITAASVTAYTGVVLPGGPTTSEQQSVTVTGTSGTFTLTFQGQTTAQIPFNVTPASLAAALNTLPSIGGVGGSVTVTQSGNVYTVTFGGTLANSNVPLLTVGSSTATATTIQTGGAASGTQAVMVTATSGTFTLSFAGQTTAPLPFNATAAQVQAALTALTGIGGAVGPLGTQEGLGGLDNVSGSNTYSGPVTLGGLHNPNLTAGQSGASIGAVPGTTLTVNSVQDPSPLVVPAPQLQKVGQGTVVFPNANSYSGQTNVVGGVLRISNANALGAVRPDKQIVTVTSPSFKLGFNGLTTLPLNQTDTGLTVQNALNNLLASSTSSTGNYNGNLSVSSVSSTPIPGGVQFTIVFDTTSNLGNTNLPTIVATGIGTGGAFTTVTQAGNGPETQNLQVISTGSGSGTFTLTFNGLNGVAQSTQPLLFNATALQVQNALNALPNIGGVGGSVIVTLTGTAGGPGGANFTITFGGTLANANVPQLQPSTTGGTTAIVTTLNDGPAGTTVEPGATLQISPVPTGGSLVMSPEVVTINGQGFNNQGALNVNGGTVLWNSNPLILGSNASVGTTSTLNNDALTFNTTITDQGNGFNLDVYGPGAVTFAGAGDNQYTGTTTVHNGVLNLRETGTTAAGGAILGPLVVSDGSALATVQEQLSNQVADTSPVTVNTKGTFDLNSLTDKIGPLAVNGSGKVLVGGTSNSGGHLTTGPVTMTGGEIDVGVGGSLTSGAVSMTAGALIAAGANSTVTAGAVMMTNSSITLGQGDTLAAASLTLAGSSIGLAAGATGNETVSTTGAVSLSAGSSISLGDASTLTVGSTTPAALTLTGSSSVTLGNTNAKLSSGNVSVTASSITLGNSDAWTAGTVALDGGTFTTGTGLTATTADETLANKSTLTVGGGTVTAGNLTMTGASTLTLGAGTTDTVQAAGLTGSTVNIGTGGTLNLNGNLTATSSVTAPAATAVPATIAGAGTLDFLGAKPTVTVNAGTGPVDLLVSVVLQTAGVTQLVKLGQGLFELAPATAFANLIDVQAGDLQVDTVTGPVGLDGGNLSGNGSVGTITGGPVNFGTTVGTISPGVGFPSANRSAGILTSTPAGPTFTDTWSQSTTFSVFLSNASNTHPNPVAGTDYSQLVVNGFLNLNGAVLDAVTGPGIQNNDTFTIITATQVTGTFSNTSVFLGGQKFQITYTNTSVILQKVLATATITNLVSSANPAEVHEPLTITATVTGEPGSGTIPATDTVTFTLTPLTGPVITVTKTKDPVTGKWVLDTQADIAGGLPPGSYAVTAVFNGDVSNFMGGSSATLAQNQVVLQPSIGTLTAAATNVATFGLPGYISPNDSPAVQDTTTLSATVSQELSASTYTVNVYSDPSLSAGSRVRTFTGSGVLAGTDVAINAVWDGKNDSTAFVPDGKYYVTLTFTDPWTNTVGPTASVSVVVDNTSPAVAAVGASTPVIAPSVASSVPTSVTLTDTVSDTNLSGWTLSVFLQGDPTHPVFVKPVSTTGVTSAAVNVNWNGTYNSPSFPAKFGQTVPDGQYLVTVTGTDLAGNSTTSATTSVFVFSSPTITVVSSNPTIVYGQAVTFTATVAVPTQLASFVTGTQVDFLDGSTQVGVQTLSQTGTAGGFTTFQASQTVPILTAGTHTITAAYPGNAEIPPGSSPPITQVVTPAPITVTADNQTMPYGGPLPTLTRTVTGLLPSDPGGGFTGTLVTTATVSPPSPVGQYQITQGTLTPDGNYTITSFTPGTLTVTPAPLTIVVDNASRVVGAPNPTFTFTAQGLVGGDTSAVVTGLTLSTTATQSSPVGTYPITAAGTPTAGANYTVVNVLPGVLSVSPQLTSFAVGSGGGGQATVNIYSAAGKFLNSIIPFPGFTGEVRTVEADFNHDGVLDIAVATGPGTTAQVKVIDGATGADLFVDFPFADFTGGVFVAAGDMTGDGIPDLVVTPDQGGGPRVVAFSGATFTPIVSFFGINDPNFRGGARATLADINHDGFADLVVAAGFGGGPRISIWDGKALSSLHFVNVVPDFFAYEPALRNGTYVAAGDVNGDGFADLVIGAGPGGGPRVIVVDGQTVINQGPLVAVNNPMANFFAGNIANRSGVRVTTKTLVGSLDTDVVTGDATGSTVTAYKGSSLAHGQPDILYTLDAFPGLNNGVYVG
ncbi:MAG: hypothetical protein JWO38_1294 [Gemmataceae bacterium]|nr:hypothetical protein [Gemmataceae bacterium]